MTANVQISTKRPTGEIYVIGGENYDDFYTNMLALYGGSVEHVNLIVGDMQESLMPTAQDATPAATNVVQVAFPQAEPVQQQAPAPAAPVAFRRPQGGPPPGQVAPVCEHGYAREWKTGGGGNTGKKAWSAWFCPLRKEEGACAPQWA